MFFLILNLDLIILNIFDQEKLLINIEDRQQDLFFFNFFKIFNYLYLTNLYILNFNFIIFECLFHIYIFFNHSYQLFVLIIFKNAKTIIPFNFNNPNKSFLFFLIQTLNFL